MSGERLADHVVERLYGQAHADRWAVARASFQRALERSALKALGDAPASRDVDRYLASLHLEDLALACACAEGHEGAWEHFVREYRPVLYKAAAAIDPSGEARDLADSLYAELFGLDERDGERRSLFRYFHGRSSLATWLRAVLAQRHVDCLRIARRFEPLPPVDRPELPVPAMAAATSGGAVQLVRRAVAAAVSRLEARDRLRLALYYVQQLTLAQIGLALAEHEATVSRNLSRARRAIRKEVEQQLREGERMSPAQIAECLAAVIEDAGELDVGDLLGAAAATPHPDLRKETRDQRSKEGAEGASA